MKMTSLLVPALIAALGLAAIPARAEQQPQGVIVYYGTADFVGVPSHGVVVGPFSNGDMCNAALEAAIAEKVELFDYVVESVTPCWPRWSFKDSIPELEAAPGNLVLATNAGSPGESVAVVRMLLKEVRAARATYRVAEYEAVLTEIYKATITDPNDANKSTGARRPR